MQPTVASSYMEGATIRARLQPRDPFEEEKQEEEQPIILRNSRHQQKNIAMNEGKAMCLQVFAGLLKVLQMLFLCGTSDQGIIEAARFEIAEDSLNDMSGGISMRLHHPTNIITKDYQNSDLIFSDHVHKKHLNASKYEFEWVPKKQTDNVKTSNLKPQSLATAAPFYPIRKTKLPIIDHVQNRDLRTARRETLYKVFAVPPSLLTADNFSSGNPSTITDCQSSLDSAQVEQAHLHNVDPCHQEEVCSVENPSTVPTALASSRLGNGARSYQPCSGKQAFSEEEVNISDNAHRKLAITRKGMENQAGSDRRTAFTQTWQAMRPYNTQSANKQLSIVIPHILSANPTRGSVPMMPKYRPELRTSKESITQNRTSSAASKSILCNCSDFSDSSRGNQEECAGKGSLFLPEHWATSQINKQQEPTSCSLQNGKDAQQQKQSLKMGIKISQRGLQLKTESSSLSQKKRLRVRVDRASLHRDSRIQNYNVEQRHGLTNTLSNIYDEEVAESPKSNLLKSLKWSLVRSP
ncbi:uncharacterized protein LOC119962496 [Scyliorhinus canicula]|uniref:uncharacterized protein LOC119962496 n=1 Tax=Scyliorhinus canicula TaxID=7830 RepID=UPI0018F6243A|nr:uncharacterized protein LOC119962496 [Scyliorhinus canicula]